MVAGAVGLRVITPEDQRLAGESGDARFFKAHQRSGVSSDIATQRFGPVEGGRQCKAIGRKGSLLQERIELQNWARDQSYNIVCNFVNKHAPGTGRPRLRSRIDRAQSVLEIALREQWDGRLRDC